MKSIADAINQNMTLLSFSELCMFWLSIADAINQNMHSSEKLSKVYHIMCELGGEYEVRASTRAIETATRR